MKYTCHCCNYETEYKSSIDKHKLTNKHITKYKTNKYCEICQKIFSTIGNYKIHYNREHVINIQDIQVFIPIQNIKIDKIDKKSYEKSHENSNIQLNKIKKIVNDSNCEIKEVIHDEINKSNKEVVQVVSNAINKASSLIKYLMEYHQSTPPLARLNQKEGLRILRIDYKCPLNKKEDIYALEKTFISDYRNNLFVRNICKSILNIVNYKYPEKQPIWNTDCSRYNYVIKTSMDKWDEDKAGIKFTDFVIKPLLQYISDLICIYRTNKLEQTYVKNFSPDAVQEYLLQIQATYKLESDVDRDNLIKPILKELSPYLRYLESELEELENKDKLNELEQQNNLEKLEELEQLQEDLEEIVQQTNKQLNSDSSDSIHSRHSSYSSHPCPDIDNNSDSDISYESVKIPFRVKYPKRTKPLFR